MGFVFLWQGRGLRLDPRLGGEGATKKARLAAEHNGIPDLRGHGAVEEGWFNSVS